MDLNKKLHPELWMYDSHPEEWVKRFISPATRSQEWDLIVEEVGQEIYKWPIFTEEFCSSVIEEAEFQNKWTEKRHYYYPTVDVLMDSLELGGMMEFVQQQFLYPVAIHVWQLQGKAWSEGIRSENFLVRYRPDEQGHLSIHHDDSSYSTTIGLNEPEVDFEGGGTWFPKQKILANPQKGECSLFPMPTHRHGGRPTTKGTRYIIVSFCTRGGQ